MPDISIVQDESLLSPFMASTHGLNREQLVAFLERFNRQPQAVRDFITSMDTFAAMKSLVTSGVVPPEYAVAVSKLVTFLAFDEVQSSQVPFLLEKLGVSPELVGSITQALAIMLRPLHARGSGSPLKHERPSPELKTIQPLTQRIGIPVPPPPPPAPQNASRNVVDLRNRPQP